MATSFFLKPLPIAAVTASSTGTGFSAPHLGLEETGLTWRSASGVASTYLIIDLGSVQSVDLVGLLFSNLRATDTVRVRAYDSSANATAGGSTGLVAGSDTGNAFAYVGNKAAIYRTKTLRLYSTPVSARHWRIDITATGHPDNFVEAVRVVLGKTVSPGRDIENGYSRFVTDPSLPFNGPSFFDWQRYARLPGCRANWVWINPDTYFDTVLPFIHEVGNSQNILFVRTDDPTKWQNDVIYGFVRDSHDSTYNGAAGVQFEVIIQGVTA